MILFCYQAGVGRSSDELWSMLEELYSFTEGQSDVRLTKLALHPIWKHDEDN